MTTEIKLCKKTLIATMIAICMVFFMTACSSKGELVEEAENHDMVIAIENEYGIDLTFYHAKEDSEFHYIIESDGYADLSKEERLEVFTKLDLIPSGFKEEGTVTLDFYADEGSGVIVSGGDEYTAKSGSWAHKESKLYKNGEQIYSMDNPNYESERFVSKPKEKKEEKDYSDLKWEPTIGMTKSEVLDTTWGNPDDRNITETEYGDVEQWVYYDLGYVYFTNGVCDGIQYK